MLDTPSVRKPAEEARDDCWSEANLDQQDAALEKLSRQELSI